MEAFPTLSRKPKWDEYEETLANDSTLHSTSEGGYDKTRARHTRYPDKFTIIYPYLTTTEKETLKTFQRTVGIGADAFTWTDPEGTSHTIRLAEPIVFTRATKATGRWNAKMTFKEV